MIVDIIGTGKDKEGTPKFWATSVHQNHEYGLLPVFFLIGGLILF